MLKETQFKLPDTGFVRQVHLLKLLPFSAPTLWRMVKSGSFPAPVKLSARITAWPVEAVHAWMQARKGVKP